MFLVKNIFFIRFFTACCLALSFLFLPFLVPAPANPAHKACSAELIVVITGIETDTGTMHLSICSDERQWLNQKKPFRSATLPIKNKKVEYVVQNVPCSTYAIKVFHDENNNGELDKNALGIPVELYGFSQGVRPRYGSPPFETACFEITHSKKHIEIRVE